MHKVLYSIIIHTPIIGPIYEACSKPKFCSPGIADGAYDFVLQLIEEHKKTHPNEQITNQLIKKLIKDTHD